LTAILQEYADSLGAQFYEALSELMRAALGLDNSDTAPTIGSTPLVSRRDQVTDARTRSELMAALAEAFEPSEFGSFLAARLDRRIETLSSVGEPFRVIVFNVVGAADSEGWTADLVVRALEAKPGNVRLAALAAELGVWTLAGTAFTDRNLQARFASTKALDAREFAARLGWIETRVCRIEFGARWGTGFLIGPDLVLTAGLVIGRDADKLQSGRAWFDYHRIGQSVERGNSFGLVSVVHYREYQPDRASGYAVLRLSEPVGGMPVGRGVADSMAALRGWIEIASPKPVLLGDPLIVVWSTPDGPLAMSYGRVMDTGDVWLRHNANMAAGSAGAPCFSATLDAVAMHAGAPEADLAMSLAGILGDLRELGLAQLSPSANGIMV
jgi:hypothetical protein